MKKILLLTCACTVYLGLKAQNNISAPTGIYGDMYFGPTQINKGGEVLVSDGGVWGFGGDITAKDKGNDNNPNETGRAESINFSGTGTYSNELGFIIDAYAGVQEKQSDFILPIGAGGKAYPLTIPTGAVTAAAYFTGSGVGQSKEVNGNAATQFRPYYDVDGLTTGEYGFSYPSGLIAGPNNYIFQTNNSSLAGTSENTSYEVLSKIPAFNEAGGTATIALDKNYGPTQIYFGSSDLALKVDLINFKGSYQDGKVKLTWNTVTETNNKGFSVERSIDGIHFSTIGSVGSQSMSGNSSNILSYRFEDNTPIIGNINYYRLLQMDKNGKKTYLDQIVKLKVGEGIENFKVYPNPAHNFVTVSGLIKGSQLSIYTISGRLVSTLKVTDNKQKVDIRGLASGVYIINGFTNANTQISTKLFIQ